MEFVFIDFLVIMTVLVLTFAMDSDDFLGEIKGQYKTTKTLHSHQIISYSSASDYSICWFVNNLAELNKEKILINSDVQIENLPT